MNEFDYTIIRSKRKSTVISIRNGKVTVRAPHSISERSISDFVNSKKAWIIKNIIRQNSSSEMAKNLSLQNQALLFGQTLSMDNLIDIKNREYSYRLFYERYSDYLVQRISELSELSGLSFSGLKFTVAKTLWGVCDARNNIRLNLGLLALPKNLSDYVIMHELVHTKHHNHSREFWDLLKSYMPDCSARRKELKKYNWVLNLMK